MGERTPDAADPERLAAALARETGAPVTRRETHISAVFLAGERAFKLKKPLTLPFLDYGSAARRRMFCEEEVRLNRRLAPDVYLRVRAVVNESGELALADADDPRAIDHVVEMRRYDEAATMAAQVAAGTLAEGAPAALGLRLAEFHDRCAPVVLPPGAGSRRAQRVLDRNLCELLEIAGSAEEGARVRALGERMGRFVAARGAELDARAQAGRVRDGHGDLRAEHVVLVPTLGVVDCVEFDPELRALDVADDLAFLVMDLTALGAADVAAGVVAAYCAAGGDPGDDGLIAGFAAHRALVRAKVSLVRASQSPPAEAGRYSARARTLLSVAEHCAWRARLPLLLVVCGVPASGKTRLAEALCRATGLTRLSSDRVRKELAGLAAGEAAAPAHYEASFNHRTYAELGRRAREAVAQAGGAVIDATFRHRSDRAAFAAALGEVAPILFAECIVPATVLADRARSRDRRPREESDATLEIVLRERSAWEPLDEVAAERHIVMRADRPVPVLVDELTEQLDRRQMPA